MRIRTRFKQEDGTWKYVYGWYFCDKRDDHYMFREQAFMNTDDWGEICLRKDAICIIVPSHTAVATGKMDKNNVKIFGSKGVFADGDNVRAGRDYIGTCEWLREDLTWIIRQNEMWWHDLSGWESEELKIIPRAQGYTRTGE